MYGLYPESVRTRLRQFHVGMPSGTKYAERTDGVASTPQSKQVDTLTIDTATGGADYVFTFEGVAYTYTAAAGSPTKAEIAEGIRDLAMSKSAIATKATVTFLSDVVTFTSVFGGTAHGFTLTESDAKMTHATTAAADASGITFGRAMVSRGYPAASSSSARNDSQEQFAQASTANLVQQADVWTLADPSAGYTTATINIRGMEGVAPLVVGVDYDTDLGTTIAALDAALDQALADMGWDVFITITSDATTITATATFAGVDFDFKVTTEGAAAHSKSSNKGWVSGSSAHTSFFDAFRGIAKKESRIRATTQGTAPTAYPANEQVVGFLTGEIALYSGAAVTPGDQVFVDLNTGATAGRFYNAGAAGRIPLPKAMARWLLTDSSTSGTSAVSALELNRLTA